MSELAVLQRPEVMKAIATGLDELGIFATKRELDLAVNDIIKRAASNIQGGHRSDLSLSRIVRGLAARQGHDICPAERDADLRYLESNMVKTRALSTGSTPGSYLVPVIQANDIIRLLTDFGALRRMQPRIWDMDGIQSLTVPVASGTPTAQWLGQNTSQTASDPNFSQLALNLKTLRALVAIPMELLATSVPAIDAILTELLAISLGEAEDTAAFATSNTANGPASIYTSAGTTFTANNGNANGGVLKYADLLNALNKIYSAKATPPFVWAFHPSRFFNSVMGILDLNSRPIVTQFPGAPGTNQPIQFSLFGFPVVLSSFIPTNQAVGSGSNQSYFVFCNPTYIHVGQSLNLEIFVSLDRFMESNQVAIRAVRKIDLGYAPSTGIVVCQGIS